MRSSLHCWVRAALVALVFVSPAIAEDPPAAELQPVEPPPVERPWKLWIEAAAWYLQPVGLDVDVATEVDTTSSSFYRAGTVPVEFGTEGPWRWRGGMVLPKDFGEVVASYWGSTTQRNKSDQTPGIYSYGTSRAYPLFSGLLDNALADGYAAEVELQTRDFSVQFRRPFVQGPKMQATWSVGGRWVDLNLGIEARYDASEAPDPLYDPLFEPGIGGENPLRPEADLTITESRFSGRGLTTGIEVRMPVAKGRMQIETGLDVALLRGDKQATYFGETNVYFDNNGTELVYLDADALATFINDPDLISRVQQRTVQILLDDSGSSGSAMLIEGYLGVRARVWKTLEVLGGIRASRYQDAVSEIVPAAPPVGGALAVPSFERRTSSVSYEGFYFGAAYTY